MSRFIWPALIGVSVVANSLAQSPAPSHSPSPSPTPSATKAPAKATPAPQPSPTPTTDDLVNSLNQTDLQAAITLLKNNFTNPDSLTETELNRATLTGLLARLNRGLMLLPGSASTPPENPFYSEIIEGHIGYLRLGSLTTANLQAMDKKLAEFHAKKVDALIVDLRSSPSTNDFAVAAEFARRFTLKGKTLFTLRKGGSKQERNFTADRDPVYQGTMMILTDGDTAGPAEALAGVIRYYDKALIIGQPTAGRAVEYSDLPLPSGKILRVAVAEAVLPENRSLFPEGVKPDLPVEMPPADKRLIFLVSAEKGMSPFIYEAGRAHLNEAALLAGTNPELDAAEAAQQRRGRALEKGPYDSVLQRAVDLVTSLAIYQKR
ncbi:MAG: carboxyl-terminal processing protease [Verrucomicrobiota bacterium]